MAIKEGAFGFCEYEDPEATLRCMRLLNEWTIATKKLVVKVDAKTKTLLDEFRAEKKEAMKKEEEKKEASKETKEPMEGGKINQTGKKEKKKMKRKKMATKTIASRSSDKASNNHDDIRPWEDHWEKEVKEEPKPLPKSKDMPIRDTDSKFYPVRVLGGLLFRIKKEEEEAHERRKLVKKLREKEAAYQERLKNWEARERKKAREYEKEREREEDRKQEEVREARRLKEFLENYDDERDDPKYYK
ncbi:RNA-binding protein 25-like [Mytilus edulis]|uniref:RNA-binding protein 25-like n=1 Tax=Mytilus edulis TaxID=6550 RepID=UPI0039EE4BCE